MSVYAFALIAVIVFLWGGLVMRYGQPQRFEGRFIFIRSEDFTGTLGGSVFRLETVEPHPFPYRQSEAPQEGPTR